MADKSDVIQDYLNSLNEAMAIHARKAVEGLEFDRTELAEIVDITNRDKGEYQVFNGSTRYFAYSENTSYTLGAKVYVTIPNNDYSQQKLIKGRYKSGDGDTGIAWVSPLQNYQSLTGNLLEEINGYKESTFTDQNIDMLNVPVFINYDNDSGYGLLANYSFVAKQESKEPLDGQSQYASDAIVLYNSGQISNNDEFNKNFKYLGLSAEFKTMLSGFYPVSGSYGLKVFVYYSYKISDEQPAIHKTKTLVLDTSSMIGNVYNFNTYYKQEALFKLTNDVIENITIDKIVVLFYQDGQFRNNNNQLISPYWNGQPLSPNILVKNINIQFGEDAVDENAQDIATIDTNNGISYDSAQSNPKISEKRIYLKWLHVNPVKEVSEDGTEKWTRDLMTSSDLRRIPSDADVHLIANIHWYKDAQYTLETFRATKAETAAKNDKLYAIVEKWKNEETRDSLTIEEINTLIQEASLKKDKDFTYLWDDNAIAINETTGEYLIDGDTGEQIKGRWVFTISHSGEIALERIITRNAKEDKALSVNDELAGPNWIPIENSWNKFEIDFQPDPQRQNSSVKCIIEVGPELVTEDEDGNSISTGLVDPDSMYYSILETNTIVFNNLSWVPDIATHDTATGITLILSDKSDGNYPLYNANDGRILSKRELEQLRTIQADMISRYTGNSLLNGNEIILWQIPKTNTMININGTLSEGKAELLTAENFDSIFGLNKEDFERAMNEQINLLQEKVNNLQNLLDTKLAEAEDIGITNENRINYYKNLMNDLEQELEFIEAQYQTDLTNYSNVVLEARAEFQRLMRSYWVPEEQAEKSRRLKECREIMELTEEEYIEQITEKKNTIVKNIGDKYKNLLSNLNALYDDISAESKALTAEIEEITNNLNQAHQDLIDNIDILNRATFNDYDLINYFEKDNFDFENYYYLIRFGSDVVGVNPYQGYYINEYYVKSATNNTIICYIVKNNQVFKGQITFNFSQHGTSGTDYTFSFGLGELVKNPTNTTTGRVITDSSEDEWEVIGPASAALTIGEEGFHRIRFDLYDSTNEKIDLTQEQKNAIIKEWIGLTKKGFYSGYNTALINQPLNGTAKNLQFLVKIKENTTDYLDVAVRAPSGNIPDFRYIIMSATVRYDTPTSTYNDQEYELGAVNFVQMLPIHVRTDSKYVLEGADYITYDDKGAKPQSYSDEYNLTNCDNEEFRIIVDDNDVSNADTINNSLKKYQTIYKWYPHLDENNKLVPCSIYVDNLSTNIAVEAFIENQTIYSAPLLIVQNRYQIPAINSWNGDLLIDDVNNRVMAATIAAGKKDNENRFTGVIMGSVGQLNDNKVQTTTGLYGYESGAEAFGFKSDGTAFIGKSGTGRIEFDGKDGFIQSANYANSGNSITNKEGTRINLTDGSIDMWGHGYTWTYDETKNKWTHNTKTGTSSNVHIDTYGSLSKPYFRIGVPVEANSGSDSDGLKSLIRIDSSNYYLQTADYGANGKGLKIDLKNGTFDSKGKLTITGGSGSSINFGDGTFVVGSDGSITATKGTIGGWTIGSSTLSSDGIVLSGSSLYATNSKWSISSDGVATFKDVNITGGSWTTGGSISFGGNSWGTGGLVHDVGSIATGTVTDGTNNLNTWCKNLVVDTVTADYIQAKHAVLGNLTVYESGGVSTPGSFYATGLITSNTGLFAIRGGLMLGGQTLSENDIIFIHRIKAKEDSMFPDLSSYATVAWVTANFTPLYPAG